MKKRLRLKKVTLRNLDDAAMDQIAGGQSGPTQCGATCPGVCQTPQVTQVQVCTWDGCSNGCQAQTNQCPTRNLCYTDPVLTCHTTITTQK